MSTVLGKLETQLFAYIQLRGQPTIESEEVVRGLGITSIQTRELLSRLARRSMIVRVRRGLYLVPPRLPPGGRWSPSEFLAIATLMMDRATRYQVCGPSAFHRYGWDEQVPNLIHVYNNRLSGERQIGSTTLSLIKVSDDRLGGSESFTTPDGARAIFSSRVRCLVDAVRDWSRFGGLPRAFEWIRGELAQNRIEAKALVRDALRYGNTGTLRRLGKLLELQGVDRMLLESIQRKLPETTALIPWCPTRPKRGKIDRRWGVVFNE